MERDFRNGNMKPLNHSRYLRLQTLIQSYWDVDEKLNLLNNLTLADLKDFIHELFSQLYIEGLCHGNLLEEEVKNISNIFKKYFSVPPLPAEMRHKDSILCLPSSADLVRDVTIKNKLDTNSVVEEFFADFVAIDPYHFTLNTPSNHMYMLPAVIDPPNLQNYCDRVVDGLAAIFLAFKRRPVIRYSRTSDISKRIAHEASQEGWWSYEFCYQKKLRQIHVEDEKVVQEFVLGEYDAEATSAYNRNLLDISTLKDPRSKDASQRV